MKSNFDFQALNGQKTSIRLDQKYRERALMSACNHLSYTSIESKLIGMENLVQLSQKGINIKSNLENSSLIFQVLFYIYIHELCEENPNPDILNNAIYLLPYTKIADVEEANRKRQINIQNNFFNYPINQDFTSLSDDISIEFLLNALENQNFVGNSLNLLNFIVKKKHTTSFVSSICTRPVFLDLCKNCPDLKFGPIVYFYFIDHYKQGQFDEDCLFQTDPDTFNEICLKMLNSNNSVNNLNLVKIFISILKSNQGSENPIGQFEALFNEFLRKLPEFLTSRNNSLIQYSIQILTYLDPIPDDLLKGVWMSLSLPFKKNHCYAFEIVKNNFERITSFYSPEEIFNNINSILSNPKAFIKEKGLELLVAVSTLISPAIYIDLDTIASFLDDPKYASIVLPLIINKAEQMGNAGEGEECFEILNNYCDQLEYIVAEIPEVSEVASKLLKIIRQQAQSE